MKELDLSDTGIYTDLLCFLSATRRILNHEESILFPRQFPIQVTRENT
jgi:hypothetical protein